MEVQRLSRCGEYTQASGSGSGLTVIVRYDIVCSIWKHIAVHKRTHID